MKYCLNIRKLGVIVFGLLLITSCGGSNLGTNPPPTDPVKIQAIINEAWSAYEKGDYTDAIRLLNEALQKDPSNREIYNGLGWSYFKTHNLLASLSHFSVAIGADSSFADAMVGYSVALYEQNEYDQAIKIINTITGIDSSAFDLKGSDEYAFDHDTSLTSKKVRKILALCYFYSGDFTQAYNQLRDYLDPFTTVSPDSDTFLLDLLKALEKI